MSASASDSPHLAPPAGLPSRPKRPLRRLVFGLLLLLALLSVPPVFRGIVWLTCHEEARRQGGELHLDAVSGSLWEPLVLSGVTLNLPSANGGRLHLVADQVRFDYGWGALFERRGTRRFFEKCTFIGARLLWEIGRHPQDSPRGRFLSWGTPLEIPAPEQLELNFREAKVGSAESYLQLEDARLTFSEVASGNFTAARMEVRASDWTKSFRDIQGRG
ncbi:MAG: hypothetical protein WCL08_12585, partial [Verrucomicrobiota bacterium]